MLYDHNPAPGDPRREDSALGESPATDEMLTTRPGSIHHLSIVPPTQVARRLTESGSVLGEQSRESSSHYTTQHGKIENKGRKGVGRTVVDSLDVGTEDSIPSLLLGEVLERSAERRSAVVDENVDFIGSLLDFRNEGIASSSVDDVLRTQSQRQ